MGGVNPEGELECFLSLLLADLSQLTAELVVLIVPSSEHSVALSHHLNVQHYSWYVHVHCTCIIHTCRVNVRIQCTHKDTLKSGVFECTCTKSEKNL